MKNKNIHSFRRKYLAFCIFISIVCPAGIPLIPLGFIFMSNNSLWLMGAIIGIALVVFGFYGLPLFWVFYGVANRRSRVYDAIALDYLYSVSEIVSQTTYGENQVRGDINWLINKRYLNGFLFNGENLTLNENKELRKKGFEFNGNCPHCGASKAIKKDDGIYCAYCGATLHIDE